MSAIAKVPVTRFVAAGLLIGAIAGTGVASVHADTTGLIGSYGPILGVNYTNQAFAFNGNTNAEDSYAEVNTTTGGAVAIGWIGVSVDVDTASGALCGTSGFSYNTFATNHWSNDANCWNPATGYYYAIGATRSYSGSNHYASYYTYPTPNDYHQ